MECAPRCLLGSSARSPRDRVSHEVQRCRRPTGGNIVTASRWLSASTARFELREPTLITCLFYQPFANQMTYGLWRFFPTRWKTPQRWGKWKLTRYIRPAVSKGSSMAQVHKVFSFWKDKEKNLAETCPSNVLQLLESIMSLMVQKLWVLSVLEGYRAKFVQYVS